MITLEIKAQLAQGRLRKLAKELGDRRAPNERLAAKLFQMVARNFDSESHDGQPWEALAPGTVRWKEKRGYGMILQNTGFLRQSFLPFSDNDVAGIGAQSNVRVDGEGLDHADLSKIHEKGLGHVPARPMLPGRGLALEEAIVIYGHFVARAVRS